MLIGYARISKADGSQSLDLQRDALREAGSSRLHQTNDRQVRSLPTEKGAVNY